MFIFNEHTIIMNKRAWVNIMNTNQLTLTIKNKLGLQCRYNKKANQLSIFIKENNELIFKPELIANIDRSNIAAVINHMKHLDKNSLLITNHANKILAEQLQKANIQFIDYSGNAYINELPIFIFVKGESPQKVSASELAFDLNSANIKIIFVLLAIKDAINLTYREIAKMSDVALGSINKTFLMLQKYNYLIIKQNGDRILANKEELLNKWCIAYAEKLRPKLIFGKFSTDLVNELKEAKPDDFNFLWGNEIAANQLTHYLKPEIITLYAENDLPKLQLKFRLKRNAQGNIEILKKFWDFNNENTTVVPHILVYADLLNSLDERNQETASLIYEQYIKKEME
ncbi:type IV toxin-antitoxin system AbiEi family antitoxin [Legionella pneumophila serogroup 1]|uniref:type IV toxin-antitoxin system AbiEi family antitoxin n=1 Tax=Legionella pneumophila TaxID=446 RepID=UPI0022B3F1FB|nr:type IV toxin-antitoxin system AbiEi family antitoxin [Legionella pneumophila]MCZ4806400.1 type IV toxin-antitoxin system AbiEi family antitoxin [Legionella pneumophila]